MFRQHVKHIVFVPCQTTEINIARERKMKKQTNKQSRVKNQQEKQNSLVTDEKNPFWLYYV